MMEKGSILYKVTSSVLNSLYFKDGKIPYVSLGLFSWGNSHDFAAPTARF